MQHNPEFPPPVFHHGLPISLNRLSVSDKGYVQKKKQSGNESVHKFSPRLMALLQVEWSFFNFMGIQDERVYKQCIFFVPNSYLSMAGHFSSMTLDVMSVRMRKKEILALLIRENEKIKRAGG